MVIRIRDPCKTETKSIGDLDKTINRLIDLLCTVVLVLAVSYPANVLLPDNFVKTKSHPTSAFSRG